MKIKPVWWRRRDSNPRPLGCEPNALPAELRPHFVDFFSFGCERYAWRSGRSKLPALTRASSQLSYAPIFQYLPILPVWGCEPNGSHLRYYFLLTSCRMFSQLSYALTPLGYYNTISRFVKSHLIKMPPCRIIKTGAVLVGEPAVPCTRNPL